MSKSFLSLYRCYIFTIIHDLRDYSQLTYSFAKVVDMLSLCTLQDIRAIETKTFPGYVVRGVCHAVQHIPFLYQYVIMGSR